MARALTFIRVIYDLEGDGEEVGSCMNLMKVNPKSPDKMSKGTHN
jgi:hypothetical protein